MFILVSLVHDISQYVGPTEFSSSAHYTAAITGRQVALADGSNSVVGTKASGIVIAYFDKNNNLDYRAFILSDDPLTSVGFYGPAGAGYEGPLLYDVPVGNSPLVILRSCRVCVAAPF